MKIEKYTYYDWEFTLLPHKDSYKILAINKILSISDYINIGFDWIDNKDDFIRECRKYYINKLSGME